MANSCLRRQVPNDSFKTEAGSVAPQDARVATALEQRVQEALGVDTPLVCSALSLAIESVLTATADELGSLSVVFNASSSLGLATQGELEESASQLRARDEQVAELKAEASRLRKRVDAKSAELESRTSVAAYIDGKFKAIADIVHRHPDCNIGAATQDVCKRVLKLEQEDL